MYSFGTLLFTALFMTVAGFVAGIGIGAEVTKSRYRPHKREI